MESLLDLDKEILVAINGAHSPLLDWIMIFFSNIPIWIPLYIAIAVWLFFPKYYGERSYIHTSEKSRIWVLGLIGLFIIILNFTLTDQIANFVKETVQRPRPGYNPLLKGVIRLPDGLGGSYGFFSGHAANSFGFALLTSLIFRKRWWSISIFIWAAIMSYSRIYLARHYPLDVLCGALAGTLIAFFMYNVWKHIIKYINKKKLQKCSVI